VKLLKRGTRDWNQKKHRRTMVELKMQDREEKNVKNGSEEQGFFLG
jgi:hypothetical protein